MQVQWVLEMYSYLLCKKPLYIIMPTTTKSLGWHSDERKRVSPLCFRSLSRPEEFGEG
jgi:hypothetical protein